MGMLSTLKLPEITNVAKPGQVGATRPVTGAGGQGQVAAQEQGGAKPAAAKPQSVVTLYNSSAFDLKLQASGLTHDAARFAGGPPSVVKPLAQLAFRVVEPSVGVVKTAGWARYHLEDPSRKVDVTFSWADAKGHVKIEGVGDFSSGARVRTDVVKGNEYILAFRDGAKIDPAAVQQLQSGQPEAASTKVTIVNQAGFALKHSLDTLGTDQSKFDPAPPQAIGPSGGKGSFAVVSTDPQNANTAGTVTYGFTMVSDEPDGGEEKHELTLNWQHGSRGSTVPKAATGVSVESSGDSRDMTFTIIGPALEFKPPEKSQLPTLRKGDKTADGWVEYLQAALNHHLGTDLVVDGDFGADTLKKVIAFQRKFKKEGVLDDGVVGDETWSFLRDGAPAKPRTDGRKPHTFLEKGVEARWLSEKNPLAYDPGGDILVATCVSVGDVTQVEGRHARFRIVDPNGVQKVVDGEILKGFEASKTGQGNRHNIKVEGFSELFGGNPVEGPPEGEYRITAYFPGELGGDSFSGVVNVQPKG